MERTLAPGERARPPAGLQRQAVQPGLLAAPLVHEAQRAPGKPLHAGSRAFMEPRFGHDLGHLRVHPTSPVVNAPVAPAAIGSGARLQRQPAPTTSLTCGTGNLSKLQASARTAQKLTGDAVLGLKSLLDSWGRAPSTITQRAASLALARGFNIAFDKTYWASVLGSDPAEVRAQDARDRGAATTIHANFQQIAADLPHYLQAPSCPLQMTSGSPCAGCVPGAHHRCTTEPTEAYVPKEFLGLPSSAILFCPRFFARDDPERAEILIHEVSHLQAFGARDKVSGFRYYGCPVAPIDAGPAPGLVEPAQFIGVADAYRCFVATQRETAAAFQRIEQGSREARQFVDEFAPRPGVRP